MKLFVKAHFAIGILFFAFFLATGAYMLFNFPELYNGREEVRMMYRATHIYILMSSLLNLMTGSYLLQLSNSSLLFLRKAASLLIIVTPIMFSAAFFYESAAYMVERPITFWSVLFLFLGVMLHALLNIKWPKQKR